ncbi:hypothetical protein D0T84_08740 [Dysgonomonas sp. 521]|uniref:caspase family protein n=1 Tax=Dysgonomonas sp. 521 TaxID=2302932 RepID=UPI0013D6913D|nr:caspase family protein [Dysgonomonas sp. 521]NDV95002.1 hypothetical protein [Dysgonomonas sp. 521]
MRYLFLFVALLFFTSLSFAQDRNLKLVKKPTENPTSQKRKAVVVGMSDYGAGKSLNNTLNDANDMADVLTRLGFEVTLLENNDLRSLKTNLNNWYTSIEGNDMAVFYFAGHGMEVNGHNYLIPVDADLNSQTDVQYNTLNVNQVLGNMDEKQVGMKLLILDACRDNPFTRSWSRGNGEKGLTGMTAPTGTYIAFAASPGAVAHDGGTHNLRNGVFTHFLKREIVKEGVSISDLFDKVGGEVSKLTQGRQTPFKNSSLTGSFYFIPPSDKPTPALEVDTEKQEWVSRMMDIESKLPAKFLNDHTWMVFFFEKERKVSDSQLLKVATAARYLNHNPGAKLRLTGYTSRKEGTPMENMMLSEARAKGAANMLITKFGIDASRLQVEWQGDRESPFAENDANEVVLIQAEKKTLSPAELVSQANTYYNNKQYNEAFPLYKQAAEQGSTEAQHSLGNCYYYGLGATQDYNQAIYWFRKVADLGNDDAQCRLGYCYANGWGVSRNEAQAVYWWKKAAEHGNDDAQYNLGICYANGRGVTIDHEQAVYWYRKGAEQGNADAQCGLGTHYVHGFGVTRDYSQAIYWWKKAAKQGNDGAKSGLQALGVSF